MNISSRTGFRQLSSTDGLYQKHRNKYEKRIYSKTQRVAAVTHINTVLDELDYAEELDLHYN